MCNEESQMFEYVSHSSGYSKRMNDSQVHRIAIFGILVYIFVHPIPRQTPKHHRIFMSFINVPHKTSVRGLEVLLAPEELHIMPAVHVALRMQLTSQPLRTTEEHTRLARRMDLPDPPEDGIPIRATKVRGRIQTGDGIAVTRASSPPVVDRVKHDVRGVVRLDARSQVGVDFDLSAEVLSFNGEQQTLEPLKAAEVAADPEEVDFLKSALVVFYAAGWGAHAMPDALEDTSEGCDPNTRTD